MKKICKKIIVTLLISGMVFTQPLTLLAADEPVVSDKMEFLADNEESLVTDAGETDEIEENLTEAPGAEEIKAGEFLTEDPVEVDTDSEKNGVPVYKTVTDSFGNQYEYNISTWYKDYKNYDVDGCTYKIDKNNKKLILQGFYSQNDIVENLYIPATTTINDEVYTTQIPLNGYSNYASPFCQYTGANKLKHLFIDSGVEVTNGSTDSTFGVFEDCKQLQSVDMTGVDFSQVNNLKKCFYGCSVLKNVAFGKNIGNVTDMSYMFYGCTSLESTNLSGQTLSEVTDMSYMFYGCTSMENFNLSGLTLSEVTDMSYMFSGCHSLVNFEFPDTDTSKCTTISNMFYDCPALKMLNLSKLKTDSLTNMRSMYDTKTGTTPGLKVLYLPFGMEGFPAGGNNLSYCLPKTMYHNGEAVNSGTYINSDMSGWILTADNAPLMNGPETQKDENGKIVRSTWDCIWFGHYFQDQDERYMDKDPIKWRILSIDDNGEALLLADQNLATWQYNGSETAVSWENSEIRKWLNSNFNCRLSDFNCFDNLGFTRNAFSFAEWVAIIESDIDGGKDKVFLLSYDDVNNTAYGFNNTPTEADVTKTAMNSTYCEDGYKEWFLRDRSYTVNPDGSIYGNDDRDYRDRYKVRPAIRLNLYDHADLWADAGTVTIDQEGQKTSDEKGEELVGSIKNSLYRWSFGNEKKVIRYGAFSDKYYLKKEDYENFIYGTRRKEAYDYYRKEETERFRLYNWFLGFLCFPDDDHLEDYEHISQNFKNWEGSCFGMSLTEGLYLAGDYKPRANNVSSGDAGVPGLDLESEINYYHFLQVLDAAYHMQVYVGAYGTRPYGDLKDKAKAINSPKDAFLISFTVPEWEGCRHAILCYGGEDCNFVDGDNIYTYRLKMYDPNYSLFDDDKSYLYIGQDNRDQEEVALLPAYGLVYKHGSKDNKGDLYYYDLSLTDFENSNYSYAHPWKSFYSRMNNVIVEGITNACTALFEHGIPLSESQSLDVRFQGINGYVAGTDFGFQGGRYVLGETDSNDAYCIKGGENDKLDACFEYGDHSIDVYADQVGATAVFSENGDVELQDLNATDFTITNVYNDDYPQKPGNSTLVHLQAKGSGNVKYQKDSEGVYKLTHDEGALSNLSVSIGTTLKHESNEEIPDAKGDVTLSFADNKVILREDTTGDGTLDHEEVFSDYIPVSEVSLSDTPVSIGVGKTKKLSVKIEPENASDKKLIWFSDKPNVVSVKDGKITGVSEGTAVITAITGFGGEIRPTGTCTVTVTENSEDPGDDDIPEDAPDGIWIRGLEAEYPYTGSAIKPSFKVYRGKTRLYEKTDYTLKFTNNTKPGNAKVTVTMKGNHSGSKDLYFQIVPADLTNDITADTVYLAYIKNKEQKPKPVLYVDGTKLKFGANDLTFTYPSEDKDGKRAYVDEGTYRIHIEPKNNTLFTGSADVDLVIAQKTLMSAVSVRADKNSLAYDDGKEISPVFTLTYKNQPLIKDQDYTVSYADDPNTVGKHTVIFTGNNTDYFGSKVYTFTVTGKYDLASARAEVSLDPEDLDEDGKALFTYGGAMPGAIVKYNGVKLTAGKDYTVSYKNHKALGTATATVKGKGSYKGSIPVDFTVKQRDIDTLSLNLGDVLYTAKKDGYKKVPVSFVDQNYKDQKLKANTDYSLTFIGTYGDAPAAGTEIHVRVKGKGNYTGTIEASYRIKDKALDFSKAKVSVNGGTAYDYTGSRIEPAKTDLVVTLANKPLGNDDYEILGCYNNIRKGNSAYIRLRGKGSYAGDKVVKFKIGAAPLERIWSDVIIRLKGIFNP